MSNRQRMIFLGGFILVVVLLVWFFMGNSEPAVKKRAPYVSSNWRKRFQPMDKDPLGVFLFNRILSANLDTNCHMRILEDDYALDSLRENDTTHKTYMFVGNKFGLKSGEIDSILVDVRSGSHLFLSYHDLTSNIIKRIFDHYEEVIEYDQEVRVFTGNRYFDLINLLENDTLATDWKAFGDVETPDYYKGLSSFMESYNFLKIKMNKGYVFVHSNPEFFYNYQVKRKDGFRHASFVINQLKKDRDIYLVEFGRLSDDYGNQDVDDMSGLEDKEDTSYFKLIFENPTLLTALLLSIAGLILFVIFRSRRTRPVVPVIPNKKDMTLAFAETITSIYFGKRNPFGMLNLQKKNFYTAIQKHFFVDLQRRQGDKELRILAEKSNKELRDIEELLQLLESKEAGTIDDQYVARVAEMKRRFYLDTGIISDATSERLNEENFVFRRNLWLPLLFIFGGIALLIVGFTFLIDGKGLGIIFWPLSIISVYLGVVRITSPILRIDSDKIVHTNSYGRKKQFDRSELLGCDMHKRGATLRFAAGKELIINLWDISSFDRTPFKRFISKIHMDNYDK